jgi:eukaryotic-like serine/threonine-protein kinase
MTEETLFHDALAKPPDERAAFLAAACAGQPALRAAVEALLAAHEASGNPLDRPPADVAQTIDSRPDLASPRAAAAPPGVTVDQTPPIAPTTVIAGRYKLIEEIGEGGMGTVFMAQQTEPVKRLVAVKIIKPGMDSREVLARFEAERQALALMDHANIAKVLDGGVTESGRPFFVMELVKGTPITQYCDQRKLTPRERLELFLPVCQAIQHAHQKGVIHRDIKPSNVLVALYDDHPVPKVIDFGLAKATGQPLTDKTLITGYGALVGTPEYMSPEQANLNNLDIDTRCDIYSLGVLLYELLTGSTPVDRKSLANAALLEVLRIVRDVEAPRPSAKLSSSANLPSIAANRGTDPARLTKLLRGELDWVLLKALEKDRGRRYETANGLARDIDRYLADEVVEARPPSTSYRLWKFARRHKGQVIAVGLVLLALLAGIAGTTIGLLRAREAQSRAEAGEKLAGERLEQVVQEKKHVEEEKTKVEAERKRADAAKRQSQRQLALSYIDRGVNELEHGDHGQGYAFLVQAYRAASDAPDLRASTRAILGAWDFDLPRVLTSYGTVRAVAFSPDETKIVTAGADKTARLWEAATGRPLGAPMKHDAAVGAVAFSPDGTKIATASGTLKKGEARLWEAATGKPLGTPMEHDGVVYAVVFSPDGTKIATASADATGRLWDAATGKPLGTPMTHDGGVTAVAFSPDGTKIATASGTFNKGEARLWEAATGKPLGTPMKHDAAVYAVAFSPDGTKLATASGVAGTPPHTHGTARLWDAATGKPLGTPMKHDQFVSAMAFSPDGTKIATVSHDHMARLWDAATGKPLGTPMKHNLSVQAMAFSPDGTKIATASDDKMAQLWDAATGKPLGTPMKHDDLLLAVAFSPDGTKIAIAGGFTARLWDAAAGKPLRTLGKQEGTVLLLAFSPDGTRIATASTDETVRLWDAATGKPLGLPMKHENYVSSLVFSPDGTKIATLASDWNTNKGEARMWDASTCNPLGASMKHEGWVWGIAFSPDGTKLATASGTFNKGEARLWDVATGKPLRPPMKHDNSVHAVAFSPDGMKIATASSDGTARLWDAATGKPLGTPMKHDEPVSALAFSPDGTKIATASSDKTARLWEATLKPLGTPMKHDEPVSALAFSPDGTKIATASSDKTARLWDSATGKPLGSPLKHDGGVLAVAFSPNGTKLATASQEKIAWSVPRSIPDDPAWIDAYSGVVSGLGEDNDGTLHPISAEAAAAHWTEIAKSPAWLEYRKAMLDENRRALHESEALRWEAGKNWFAAAFHLRWLDKHDPDNVELRNRLRDAEAEWAKTREQMKQQENLAPAPGLPQPAIPRLPADTQTPPTTHRS